MSQPWFAVSRYLKQGLGRLAIQNRLEVSKRTANLYISQLPEKRAEFDRLLRSGAPALEVAKMWGCSRSHVENLRRELAIPHKSRKTVDYTRIDYLFEENRTNAQIVDILCRESDIPRRTLKGRVEYRRYQRKIALADDEPREPMIPPEQRQEMARKATMRRLGMDRPTFERVWLPAHIWTADRGFVEARG